MDSDDNSFDNEDSGNVSCGNDDSGMEVEMNNEKERANGEEDYPFEILTTEETIQHMINCIKEVNTVIEIPATITRILLNHFKWDKEKLMEKYYDGDQETFFKEAHVINPFNKPMAKKRPKAKKSALEECEICFTVFSPSMMSGLECGHNFCKNCWGGYLKSKIMDDGLWQSIPCAAQGCDLIVDDDTVMKLVPDSHVKLKYQHLIANSFVECNRLLRWCPSAGCAYAVKVAHVESRPVTCKCAHVFCFECGEKWHDPLLCHFLKKWLKKCEEDSATFYWIAANTKGCPKCNVSIEKNGGCNHMMCNNQSCKHEFCWICLGSWAQHASSNCNRYDENKSDARHNSRENLARYLHYYHRYRTHMQSLGSDNNLYACVKAKMKEMQELNMSWIEVQFLKRAVDTLCQCRQTLMYTYAFAYYLRKNNQFLIFEENQNDMEMATEQLSGYLERDITLENVVDVKQRVQDKFRYCEKRRTILLDHVHEGYEKDWWLYTE